MTVHSPARTPPTGADWRLVPELSTAAFHVGTFWGLATVHGRFSRLDGGIDPSGRMWLVIDATSLDTGNPRRDEHLRSPDFFDSERHPQISFRSAGAEPAGGDRLRLAGDAGAPGDTLRLAGDLRVAGHGTRLELEPAVQRHAERLELDCRTTVDQRLLGMTYRRFGIRVPATLAVHAVLAPAAKGPAGMRAG